MPPKRSAALCQRRKHDELVLGAGCAHDWRRLPEMWWGVERWADEDECAKCGARRPAVKPRGTQ